MRRLDRLPSVPVALLLIGLLGPARLAWAQTPIATPSQKGLAVGYDIERLQDAFGLGLQVTSPLLFHDSVRFLLGGAVAWDAHALTAGGQQDWVPFGHLRLVVEGGGFLPGGQIRLYGFGGFDLLVLPGRLSANSLGYGGIGGFGFEFYFPSHVSYFIELGGLGNSARADRLPASPFIVNGFLTQVGFRFYP